MRLVDADPLARDDCVPVKCGEADGVHRAGQQQHGERDYRQVMSKSLGCRYEVGPVVQAMSSMPELLSRRFPKCCHAKVRTG